MISNEIPLDLETLRRRAKELQRQAKQGGPEALQFIASHASGLAPEKLAISQLALARSLGFANWARLKRETERLAALRLFDSAESGDRKEIARILAIHPGLAKAVSPDGATLLHSAVVSNDPEIARILIAAGTPRNLLLGQSSHTALSWAVTVGSFQFAEALIDAGDDADLFCAAGLGLLDLVRQFWVEGTLVSHPSKTGSSRFDESGNRLPRPPESDLDQVSDALYLAARGGHREVSEWLIEHGADPNFRGYEGATSLHWAEFSGNEELAEYLRAHGASDELLDHTFRSSPRAFSVITPAAYGMPVRLIKALDRFPDRVNARGGWGTPLNAAAWNGQKETAQILVERGADLTARNAAGLTPPEVAESRKFDDLAEWLRSLTN